MITQKQLDKLPQVSIKELADTKDSLRNYFVYIGTSFPTGIEQVHVGFSSTNHLDTIKKLTKGEPIFKVLLDNRKFGKK